MRRPTSLILLICALLAGCQGSGSMPSTGEHERGMGAFDRAMMGLMEDMIKTI